MLFSLPAMIAQVEAPPVTGVSFMPLSFQIAFIVLLALFIFSFSVAREPRGWRRLFQSVFANSDTFSVNKNKVIDESLKRYGIVVSMIILVFAVGVFVWGVTDRQRNAYKHMNADDMRKLMEIKKIQGSQGASGARGALSQ
jgi:hypothetical protein